MVFNITSEELQLISGYIFSQAICIGCVFISILFLRSIFNWKDSPLLDFILFLPFVLMFANFIVALQVVFTSGLKTIFGF